jgi:putative transcriptional regulator
MKRESSDDICEKTLTIVRVNIDPNDPAPLKHTRADLARVDATTEQEIQAQIEEDEKQAMQDAGQYIAGIRKKLDLTQIEFARIINVSSQTIRNWEQGKRFPSGPAKALLQVLSIDPKTVLSALRKTPRSF